MTAGLRKFVNDRWVKYSLIERNDGMTACKYWEHVGFDVTFSMPPIRRPTCIQPSNMDQTYMCSRREKAPTQSIRIRSCYFFFRNC